MFSKSLMRGSACVALLCGLAFAGGPVAAQQVTSVPLILQDFSDCSNGNVTDPNGLLTKGTAWIVKNGDGSLNIKVGFTLVPNTTYHFFLKCVRLLGDITTGDEGTGEGIYTVPAGTVGNVFAFDSYPEGAPAGNKMQSMTVRLP
jgi:hypothetical protein